MIYSTNIVGECIELVYYDDILHKYSGRMYRVSLLWWYTPQI